MAVRGWQNMELPENCEWKDDGRLTVYIPYAINFGEKEVEAILSAFAPSRVVKDSNLCDKRYLGERCGLVADHSEWPHARHLSAGICVWDELEHGGIQVITLPEGSLSDAPWYKKKSEPKLRICEECEGEGIVRNPKNLYGVLSHYEVCIDCGGPGLLATCDLCDGEGGPPGSPTDNIHIDVCDKCKGLGGVKLAWAGVRGVRLHG